MSEVTAIGKNIRISPKKVRIVARNFSGKGAKEALVSLKFVQKRAALPLSKVLKSAIANAENSKQLKNQELTIKAIMVDEGPTLKRVRAVSRGAAHQILKRTSQIKVILGEK
ncbi:50S ribosomal protein L22 [Patescibacteria group bacterium]|nr:50S ribosomal protein L22 [Patescibacteria group bacterium]